MLDQWKIPYTGSGAFASALPYNKVIAKEKFKQLGIKTPNHVVIPKYEESIDGLINFYSAKVAKQIHDKLAPPWIIKSILEDSVNGIKVIKTYPELVDFLISNNNNVIVEESIEGKRATVGVIDNFRDKKTYILPGQISSKS